MGKDPVQTVHKRYAAVQKTIWKTANERISAIMYYLSNWQQFKDCEGLGADILILFLNFLKSNLMYE